MDDIEMFVEERELAPGVLEEEAPTDGEHGAKQVHRKDGHENENGVPIGGRFSCADKKKTTGGCGCEH